MTNIFNSRTFLSKCLLLSISVFTFTLLHAAQQATTVTLNMSNYFSGNTSESTKLDITDNGIKLTADKASAQNNPAYNINKGLCIYAGGTLTIDAGSTNITAVSFTINTKGMSNLAELTSNTGSLVQKSQTAPSWSGFSSKVVLTVGATATYGTSTSGAGQLCFTSVTITTESAGTQGGSSSLLPEYPFVKGEVLYYGTSYSQTPNFQLWLVSDDAELDLSNSTIDAENASVMRVDLYKSSTTDICGSYTVATDGNFDKSGAICKTYSYWTTFVNGDFVEKKLTSGTVKISCVSTSNYTIEYDLQEENNGMHHTGKAVNIPLTAVLENGGVYNLTNTCTDTAIEVLDAMDSSSNSTSTLSVHKRMIDGHICIEKDGVVFSVLGQKMTY